jgi:signal transduction histidine kinase
MERTDTPEIKDEAASRSPEGEDARGGHLGFVAHEIRNPLSTALWTAEMLARMSMEERGGARGEKLSAMCLRSVMRVRQLVEDHFFCERIDAGGLSLKLEPLGAKETLEGVLAKHPAQTTTSDADAELGVTADRGLLERGLDALVAVAGAGGVPVTITVRGAGRQVAFHVKGKAADEATLADPIKGSPSDPTGRALAVPLARRVAVTLGGSLSVRDGGWLLTLPRAEAYTPRPGQPGPA